MHSLVHNIFYYVTTQSLSHTYMYMYTGHTHVQNVSCMYQYVLVAKYMLTGHVYLVSLLYLYMYILYMYIHIMVQQCIYVHVYTYSVSFRRESPWDFPLKTSFSPQNVENLHTTRLNNLNLPRGSILHTQCYQWLVSLPPSQKNPVWNPDIHLKIQCTCIYMYSTKNLVLGAKLERLQKFWMGKGNLI